MQEHLVFNDECDAFLESEKGLKQCRDGMASHLKTLPSQAAELTKQLKPWHEPALDQIWAGDVWGSAMDLEMRELWSRLRQKYGDDLEARGAHSAAKKMELDASWQKYRTALYEMDNAEREWKTAIALSLADEPRRAGCLKRLESYHEEIKVTEQAKDCIKLLLRDDDHVICVIVKMFRLLGTLKEGEHPKQISKGQSRMPYFTALNRALYSAKLARGQVEAKLEQHKSFKRAMRNSDNKLVRTAYPALRAYIDLWKYVLECFTEVVKSLEKAKAAIEPVGDMN